jgi:hypothetical protein
MTSTKYIGMDVHKESISIAVRNSAGLPVPNPPKLPITPFLDNFPFPDHRLAISIGTDAPVLACEVIDQAKWILDIAARKIGLVLDNFTALLY